MRQKLEPLKRNLMNYRQNWKNLEPDRNRCSAALALRRDRCEVTTARDGARRQELIADATAFVGALEGSTRAQAEAAALGVLRIDPEVDDLPARLRSHTAGAAAPTSDIYSLGIVLYESLAGRPPFEGETPVAIAYKHVQQSPVLRVRQLHRSIVMVLSVSLRS